jgi:hypothetical protein
MAVGYSSVAKNRAILDRNSPQTYAESRMSECGLIMQVHRYRKDARVDLAARFRGITSRQSDV